MKNRIIDKIMIVNEIDKKFNFDDGFINYPHSTLLPQNTSKLNMKNSSRSNLLKIPTLSQNIKRTATNTGVKLNPLNTSDSIVKEELLPNEDTFEETQASGNSNLYQIRNINQYLYLLSNLGGVLNYMLNRVSSKQKRKKYSKQVLLNTKLAKIYDNKIHNSSKQFADRRKRQKFMIINALLK